MQCCGGHPAELKSRLLRDQTLPLSVFCWVVDTMLWQGARRDLAAGRELQAFFARGMGDEPSYFGRAVDRCFGVTDLWYLKGYS